MFYSLHCSTRSDGGALKTERVSSQPPIQRRNSFVCAIALVLMAVTLTMPIGAWADNTFTIQGVKFIDTAKDNTYDGTEELYKSGDAFIAIVFLNDMWKRGIILEYFLELKGAIIQEMSKASLDLSKGIIFNKMLSYPIFTGEPNIFDWVLLRSMRRKYVPKRNKVGIM